MPDQLVHAIMVLLESATLTRKPLLPALVDTPLVTSLCIELLSVSFEFLSNEQRVFALEHLWPVIEKGLPLLLC